MDRGTSLEKVSVRHEFCPIFVSSCLCEYVGLFLSGDETFYSESQHTASEVLSDTFKVVWVCNTALCSLISYTTAGSCQISSVSFQPESHTLTHNTCREQRGDIVQFAHPVWEYRCYVCPPQLFLYCHKQTYAYSKFCFNIQNDLQTPFKSKTSRRGKTAENDLWRVVDPSQAASVRCFRSNTILTVLLFLAIWFGGRVSCLLIKNSMDRSPASPVYLGQDTVPQCIHINCLSQDQGSDATKWTLAIKNVWLQFLLQRVSRPLIRFRGCRPGEPTI